MQVPEQCAKLQYLNKCSQSTLTSFIAMEKKAFFIFRHRLMSLSMWGVGTVILNAVKVLDCLVALRQESLGGRFFPRGLLSLYRKVNSESLLINIWPTMPATKTTEI